MKKRIAVVALALLACVCTQAFALNTITIGPGYGFFTSSDKGVDSFMHGPGISFSGMIGSDSSHLMFFADANVGFPLSMTTNGIEIRRADVDMLMTVDMAIGLGYISDPGRTSWFVGGGFYFAELAANYRRVVATLDFMFGASLYAGYQFYLGENAFIEPSVRASMTFYDIGKISTSFGDSDWMGDSYIGFNGQAKLAIGYNF